MSRKRNHRMRPEMRALHQRGLVRAVTDFDTFARFNQLHDDEEVGRKMIPVRAALVRMLEGVGDDRDFNLIGGEINTCWIAVDNLHKAEGRELVLQRLAAGGEALNEAERIKQRHGHYGFTGPGRAALGESVDAIELAYRATSPLQLEQAERQLEQAVRAQARSHTPEPARASPVRNPGE